MSRTIKTVNRPEPHVFVRDQDVPPDHEGRFFCRAVVNAAHGHGRRRCALPNTDSVHVPAGEVYEATPPAAREIEDRMLGEAP